jgi:hypothetical protein
MKQSIRKTDSKGRLRLDKDFACCVVAIEFHGDEIRIRKLRKLSRRRYTFKQLISKVTKKNIHPEFSTGKAVGKERLSKNHIA